MNNQFPTSKKVWCGRRGKCGVEPPKLTPTTPPTPFRGWRGGEVRRQADSGGAANQLPDTLTELAVRVQRLSPSHRDPESFHEEKSEIVAALHQLASEEKIAPGGSGSFPGKKDAGNAAARFGYTKTI